MRVAISDQGHDAHQPDQHFVASHSRDGCVQPRYFAGKSFAAHRVERIRVSAG
jgi:hypothetical protein